MRSKPSLTVLTQLAISLVFELGLNRPLQTEPHPVCHVMPNSFPKASASTVRTMEERRAVLGCFLISSTISSYLRKMDALRWTPHMEECLQILAERPECPTDKILVQQVKLQLIVEKVNHCPWLREAGNAESMGAPPAFYLEALKLQLQEAKRQIPIDLQQNEVVLAHLYHTELSIHEIALSEAPTISSTPDFRRVESLYACLRSIRSWFDVFFTIPVAEYIGFPFSIFSQMSHCMTALYKLSTLEDPAWNKDMVRNTANVLSILDQIITNMKRASILAGLEDDDTADTLFKKALKVVSSLRLGWQAKLAVEPTEIIQPGQVVDEVITEAFPMDFQDDLWLTDILTSWES